MVCGIVISFHALGTTTGQHVTDVCGDARVKWTVLAKGCAETDFRKDPDIFVGMNPKIGVTTMGVERRAAGAYLQPTFMIAGVEVVVTCKLIQHQSNQARKPDISHALISR